MLRFFLLLTLCPTTLLAQFNDSFSDGEILNNPEWFGQVDSFFVNNDFQLQLNASDAGTSSIYLPSEVIEDATWKFSFTLGFSPSSSNYARIYLALDHNDLKLARHAIYVDIGKNSDRLELISLENGVETVLLHSDDALFGAASNAMDIEILRLDDLWTLKYKSETDWISVGEKEYESNFASVAFAIYCQYTKTRKDKFFFDDISVDGSAFQDNIPPELLQFELINGEEFKLFFSEDLDPISIQTEDFYLKQLNRFPSITEYNASDKSILLLFNPALDDISLDTLLINNVNDFAGNTLEQTDIQFTYERVKVEYANVLDEFKLEMGFSRTIPEESWNEALLSMNNQVWTQQSYKVSEDMKIYTLQFDDEFKEGETYNLVLSDLRDDRGDTIRRYHRQLWYYNARRFDIVFNEFMVDPTPAVALPVSEYIELHNRSAYDLDIKDWVLEVNNRSVLLPQFILNANGYMALVPSNSEDEFDVATIPLPTWPTLTNDGLSIVLRYSNNMLVDAYNYNPDEIQGDRFKRDGGWSVERVDVNNQSNEVGNWVYSLDLKGGTPSAENSLKGELMDQNPPKVEYIEMLSDSIIEIRFSELMQLENTDWNYTIKPDDVNSSVKCIDSVFYSSVTIGLTQGISNGKIYEIQFEGLTDWAGNALIQDNPLRFALADSVETGDVIINEILFNPRPDGVDFIELFNRSDKVISVSDLYLAQWDENREISKLVSVSDKDRLLFSNEYLLLSGDSLVVQSHYECKNPQAFLNVKGIPSMPDDEGSVVLSNRYGVIIDYMDYLDQMHFDLIKDTEGVSLERLSTVQSGQDQQNWHSTASDVAYGTPSYRNSQSIENKSSMKNLELDQEVFSPNGDGVDDQLVIRYYNEEEGGTINIRIYDARGNEIRYLINNHLMAQQGFYTWDGLGEQGQKLMPGLYVIWIQIIYPSGKVIKEKLVSVISPGIN